ncbi:MAG: hypothetical protein K6G51_03295 [Sphaerochaetaceae bacterium]|nr:hypothetical protein [Sphaerochaetaceae bacterium]
MKRFLPIYILTIVVILISSCTVTEDLILNKDGGSLSSDIDVENYFVEVLEDFAEFMPESNEPVIDKAISEASKQLSNSGYATDVVFIKDGKNSYVGNFNFNNLNELMKAFNENTNQTVIKKDENSIKFYVDINNYSELEDIIPFLADPNIEVYLAKYNVGYSEQDYLEMLVFSLGEEAPESVQKSIITLNITVPGTITKIEGATKTGDNSMTYSFRLLDFLLLNNPLTFYVEWE